MPRVNSIPGRAVIVAAPELAARRSPLHWAAFFKAAMADTIDYILKFDSLGQAQADLVVGPFFTVLPSPASSRPSEVLVYRNSLVDSVTPASGYWCVISTSEPNAALAGSANLQIVNDRTLMLSGQPSVLSAAFDTSHTNIIYSSFGTYRPNGAIGLQLI